jgi:hypothetical protein
VRDHELYDETEAGRYLGGNANPISPRTLQRQRQTGDGPTFVKVGGAVRYLRSDLDRYLADQRRLSTSAARQPEAA